MKTIFFMITFCLVATLSFSQDLTFKHGKVYNSDMKKLKTSEVQEILASNPEALKNFNAGVSKGSVGGFMVGFGIGLTIGDLVGGLLTTKEYPSALTYAGVTSFVIGLPISIGTNKKKKAAIELYNEKKTVFNIEKSTIILNQNGIGMRVNF